MLGNVRQGKCALKSGHERDEDDTFDGAVQPARPNAGRGSQAETPASHSYRTRI